MASKGDTSLERFAGPILKRARERGIAVPDAVSSLDALRDLPDDVFTATERKTLLENALKRARRSVPSAAVREQIRGAAQALGASPRSPLGKKLLATLDEKFLARAANRRPDPKHIRWVLRACGLHPQGRAVKYPPESP
jgi:hypothetical protein